MIPIDWARIWGWIITFLNLTFWQSFASELIAVFIVVFAALWISNWSEKRKAGFKKDKIHSSLKGEVNKNIGGLKG